MLGLTAGTPYVTQAVCFKTRFVCRVTTSYTVLEIVRCVMLAICMAWHLVLIFHGLRDAARMPYQVARYFTFQLLLYCYNALYCCQHWICTCWFASGYTAVVFRLILPNTHINLSITQEPQVGTVLHSTATTPHPNPPTVRAIHLQY